LKDLNRKLKILGFIILFLGCFSLLLLPATYFDTGDSMCLSVVLADTECYACGMTRGIQHLIHLDFEGAYNYNWLSFIVLPLVTFLTLREFITVIKKKEEKKEEE
jgi:hypothetical protein